MRTRLQNLVQVGVCLVWLFALLVPGAVQAQGHTACQIAAAATLIVLDASGSMSMGGKPNRLESARTELKKLIK